MLVILPSGMAGEVRKIMAAEGRFLSDKQLLRQGLVQDKVMSACWVRTTDQGIYTFGDRPNFAKCTVSDRTRLMVDLRIATHGSIFQFDWQCANELVCGARNEWEIDLLKDLPTRPIPESTRQALKTGQNAFETQVAGFHFVHKILLGEDQISNRKAMQTIIERLNRQRQGEEQSENLVASALAFRIVSIDGKADLDYEGKIAWIEQNLSMADVEDLMTAFDEQDGGIDAQMELRCPACGTRQDVPIPFDGSTLLTSKRARKSS